MVTLETERLAGQAQDVLDDYDPVALVTVAAASAGGVIAAQTITDAVMGMAGLNPDPQGLVDYGASIGIKGAIAVAFGLAAAQLSGIGLIATAFMGLGALASAGVDMIDMLLTTAPLGGSAPAVARSSSGSKRIGSSSTSKATSGSTPSPTVSASGGSYSFR